MNKRVALHSICALVSYIAAVANGSEGNFGYMITNAFFCFANSAVAIHAWGEK